MTLARAAVVLVALSLAAAALVGLISRTPARLRDAEPPAELADPSLGAGFPEEVVARHGAYRRTTYVTFLVSVLLEIAMLVVLARGPLAALVDRTQNLPGGWFTRAVLAALAVAVVGWLVTLPLGYVRGYVIEHAWGLSAQDVAGWLSDRLRGLLVSAVLAAIAAIAFFGTVRWQPRTWWVFAWAVFTTLTVLVTFLWPVLIAPLFNRFTPVEDASLAREIRTMASGAGVEIGDVLVADASRRSSVENAYVAGLGGTKQMVLYDTLLANSSRDETMLVVAHELGHEREGHVAKGVALAAAGLFVAFGALAWLARQEGPWRFAGAEGIGDVKALPVLLLFATIATLITLPVQNAVSRSFERSADRTALELTEDPETAIRVQRRLALSNISDLRPPRAVVWLLYTHPPTRERIGAALNAKDGNL